MSFSLTLKQPFWAIIAVPITDERRKDARIFLLQHTDEMALEEELDTMHKNFKGVEILSDYTKIALN